MSTFRRERSRGGRLLDRAGSNTGTSNGSASENLMFALRELQNSLKYDWPLLLKPNANPIEMAVALLDDTSVGMADRYEDFENLRLQTSQALKNVVHDQCELFNQSISSYHLLLPLLGKSKQDSTEIKEILTTTTRDIHSKSDTLNELNSSVSKMNETITMLDAIQEVNLIPEKIDKLIADKKLNLVYDVIFNGYTLAEKYNLWNLSAMGEIQQYLDAQSNSLFDMIIDELLNEIYLKNSLNQTDKLFTSWDNILNSNNAQLASFKVLIKDSTSLEQFVNNSANLDIDEITEVLTNRARTFKNEKLEKLHRFHSPSYKSNSADSYAMILDTNVDSQTDSLGYIFLLLHTASRLGRLNQVTEVLTSRVQLELHNLIIRSIDQTKLKHSYSISKMSKVVMENSRQTIITGDANMPDSWVVILQDLFGSVFIQFLIVLEKHKVISDIVNLLEGQSKIVPLKPKGNQSANTTPKLGGPRTSSTYDLPSSPSTGSPRTSGFNIKAPKYSFHEIWNTMKKELQTFITNHIYDVSPIVDNTNFAHLKETSKIYDVMKRRDIFKLDQVDQVEATKSSTDIQDVLQNMFPGLTIAENTLLSEEEASTPYIINETASSNFDIIVPRDLINMRVILEFFLIFVSGANKIFHDFTREDEITGPIDKSAVHFFEDFMKISFLSQIKESMDVLYREYIANGHRTDHNKALTTQYVGFKTDIINIAENADINANSLASLPEKKKKKWVYQSAFDFKKLFVNFCSALNTSVNYRAEYSGLVVNFLNQFTAAYSIFFKELVSNDEVSYDRHSNMNSKPVSQISKWLRVQQLKDIGRVMLDISQDDGGLVEQEIDVMINRSGNGLSDLFKISKDDYLDLESFDQTCYLFLTVNWILEWLPQMKKEGKHEDPTAKKLSSVEKLKNDWSFYDTGKSHIDDPTSNTFLALMGDKAHKFDRDIDQFKSIREDSLLALRYDIRCKCLYYIGQSLSQVDWVLNSEPGDPDIFIGLLVTDLSGINTYLKKRFDESHKEHVYRGLGEFINHILIKGSEQIVKINSYGIKRIMLNITQLNQLLKTLFKTPEKVNFTMSSAYFQMFTLNENAFKDEVKLNTHGFSSQDYTNMARLIYSEKLGDGQGSSFNKSKYAELGKFITNAFESET